MAMIFKKELAKIPLFGWQLYLGPYVMIDRTNMESAMMSIEEARIKMEKKNISIVVFAEGTRSNSVITSYSIHYTKLYDWESLYTISINN